MPSVIDICNMALSRCGNSERINDLDEASTQAEQCQLFYELSRDFVLRDYAWGFARAFVELPQLATNPDPQFAYAYAVPIDCLKIRGLVNTAWPPIDWPFCDALPPRVPEIAYRVINAGSNQAIATNASPAKLDYTVKIENPQMFDPIFVSALAWYLAGQIAPAVARDAGIATTCLQQYAAEILRAAAADLNENQTSYQRESDFITVRG